MCPNVVYPLVSDATKSEMARLAFGAVELELIQSASSSQSSQSSNEEPPLLMCLGVDRRSGGACFALSISDDIRVQQLCARLELRPARSWQ